MNRRGFFGLLGGTVAAAIELPDLELLIPKRTIFLPPACGWGGNRLLTAKYIAEEALRVLSQNLDFMAAIAREYSVEFRSGEQWSKAVQDETGRVGRISIQRLPRYDVRIDTGPLRFASKDIIV